MDAPPPAYESINADRRISLSPRQAPSSSRSIPSSASSSSSNRRPTTRTPTIPSTLPLTIPTKKYPLSSGFPYHSSIFKLGISPDTWTQFSDQIVQATKLSLTQQSLAWTSGISVGLVSVAAVPPFGAAAGVFAHKAVSDKTTLRNVRNGLEQGKLGEVLKRWNHDCWREKGVVVKLVVKHKKAHQSQDKKRDSSKDDQKKKEQRKEERQTAGHFELVLESTDAIASEVINNRSSVLFRNSSDTEDSHTDTNSSELEGGQTHTNSVPVELEDDQVPSAAYELPIMSNSEEKLNEPPPPELPPRPTAAASQTRPLSALATEKAAHADAARLSWTSAHPSESPQSPRVSILDDDDASRRTSDEIRSPVSAISRSSFTSRHRRSRDADMPPVTEVDQTSEDIIDPPSRSSFQSRHRQSRDAEIPPLTEADQTQEDTSDSPSEMPEATQQNAKSTHILGTERQMPTNIETSPIAEAERMYFEHLHAPIDKSLAPAPLFAR